MKLIEITGSNFDQEVRRPELLVLAVFYATPWCWPCKAIAPIVEELAKEYLGKLKVVQINTEHNEELSQRYNITSIPTLLLLRRGDIRASIRGLQPKSAIKEKLEEYLNEGPAKAASEARPKK